MIRERTVGKLDSWLNSCSGSEVEGFDTFAAGLRQDYAAVRAALTESWSNGQAEGQINRLKMIKRQMYGRSELQLASETSPLQGIARKVRENHLIGGTPLVRIGVDVERDGSQGKRL